MGADSGKAVKVTCEQGQLLLRMASGFVLPSKLGNNEKFDVAERAHAADQVRALWKELRSRSPRYVKDRKLFFGPYDGWKEEQRSVLVTCKNCGHKEMTADALRLDTPEVEVPVTVNLDIRFGVYWVLLLTLHPESENVCAASLQEDVIWKIAERFQVSNALRKAIGTYKTKSSTKLELDEDMPKLEMVEDEEPVLEEGELDPRLDPK